MNRPRAPWWCFFLFAVMAVALHFPLINMAVGAFWNGEAWSINAFAGVLANPYWMEALGRSLWLGLVAAICSSVLGFMAALALHGRRSGVLGHFLNFAMLIPEIVFALTLLLWFSAVGLSLGLSTLILAHVTFSISFSFWILRSGLEKLDPLLFEAAQDLGAGLWESFFKVTLPLMLPSFAASVLVAFLLSFDDFLISFFVNGVGTDTLPIKLYSSMKTGMSNETNALAFLMSLISGLGLLLATRSRVLKGLLSSEKLVTKHDIEASKT